MNIYCRGDGYIFHIDPERIYQGSAGVNTIRFIGCFPSTAQVLVSYKLPNGLLTSPKILTFVSKLEEVSAPENGGKYSVWETVLGAVPRLDIDGKVLQDGNGNIVYDLDYTITENYGTAEMQFFIYPASYSVAIDDIIYNVGEGSLATAKMFFTIEKGDPALIPPIEELTSNDAKILLAEILNMVSSSNQNIDVVETELNEKIDRKQDKLGFAGYYDRTSSPVVTLAYHNTALAQKQDNLTFDGMYSPTANPVATVRTVVDKLAEIIGNAPESLNTLEEIAAWIAAHPESIPGLNALIAQNTQSIEGLQKRQSELIVKNIQQDGRFVDIEEGIAQLQYEDDVLKTNIEQNVESLSELRQEFENYVSGGGFGVDDETVKAIVEEETSPKFEEIESDITVIKRDLTNKQGTVSFDGDYNATTNKAATVATVSREIAKLVADAPEAFDTLEEIAKWIAEHPESVAQLNALIAQNAEAIAQLQETAVTKTNVEETVDSALEEAKASGEFDGPRGTGILNTTTGIAAYTTAVNGVTPSYRILLSTLKTQAKVNEVLIGDSVRYSFYLYPVITMDETYAYLGTRVSIRGATGAAGTNGADGLDGISVTVKSVAESTEDGGSNVVTFSDGKTLTIKNGSRGSQGVAGKDYVLTEADKTEIANEASDKVKETLVNEGVIPKPVDYTNLVPNSVNKNGDLYNSCGYLNNYCLNFTGEAVAKDDAVVTGFMPYTHGSTIRVTGSPYYDANSSARYWAVYDTNKALISAIKVFALISTHGATFVRRTDGMYELTVNTSKISAWSNAKFFRLSEGRCYGRDLIVTVNEEIEEV